MTVLVKSEIPNLTTGVNNKTDKVNSWRGVVNSSHCASVVGSISHLYTVYYQSTIPSQVYSVSISPNMRDFCFTITVHSSEPQPFGFYCGAGFGNTGRPIQ